MITYNIPKLEKIIKRYKSLGHKHPDNHVIYCVEQQNLRNAIIIAAKAIDDQHKVHFHQRRVKREDLAIFSQKLVDLEDALSTVTTFEDLSEIVNQASSPEISELTIYDTAFRIGHYLKIYPDKIYLQGGVRKGAEHLLGLLADTKYLAVSELPSPFQQKNLTQAEVEDILYLYRDELENCVKIEED